MASPWSHETRPDADEQPEVTNEQVLNAYGGLYAAEEDSLSIFEETRSEASDDLPTAPTAFEQLLNQMDHPKLNKRSVSCPPKLHENRMLDLVSTFEHLSTTLPHTDPVEPPASPDVYVLERTPQARGITIDNAQTILNPDACLFVANLPIHISDQEIQLALTQFMAKGAEVFVKVNRTRAGLPFAHVQYLDAHTAREILETKNHRLLWNRQLRIEPACATRYIFLGRRDKFLGLPTEHEIRSLFSDYEVESVREPTEQEQGEVHVQPCVVVHFSKWGECGEAVRSHRNNPMFWVKTPKKSQLAHPNTFAQHLPPRIPTQGPLIQMPFINWPGIFPDMMPFVWPSLGQLPITSCFDRPSKRRKRQMDALPSPRYPAYW